MEKVYKQIAFFIFCNLHRQAWDENASFRETREGWSLLTIETEVNGDSMSTNDRGPSLVGALGLSCRYKRFLFCLGCSRKIFRLMSHIEKKDQEKKRRQALHLWQLQKWALEAIPPTEGNLLFFIITSLRLVFFPKQHRLLDRSNGWNETSTCFKESGPSMPRTQEWRGTGEYY